MVSTSISGLLGIPAIILVLGSSFMLLSKKRGKEGGIEMVIGSIMMAIPILGNYFLYYFFVSSQYQFEQNQEQYYAISDFIRNFMPLGLMVFAIGFARLTKLFGLIRGRTSV